MCVSAGEGLQVSSLLEFYMNDAFLLVITVVD